MRVLNVEEQALLEEICTQNRVPRSVVEELLDLERDLLGMGRRHGLYERIGEILEKAVRNDAWE